MPNNRLDPNPDNPSRILTLRITETDYGKLRELARVENRVPTAQLRHLVQQATLNLSVPQARRKGGAS